MHSASQLHLTEASLLSKQLYMQTQTAAVDAGRTSCPTWIQMRSGVQRSPIRLCPQRTDRHCCTLRCRTLGQRSEYAELLRGKGCLEARISLNSSYPQSLKKQDFVASSPGGCYDPMCLLTEVRYLCWHLPQLSQISQPVSTSLKGNGLVFQALRIYVGWWKPKAFSKMAGGVVPSLLPPGTVKIMTEWELRKAGRKKFSNQLKNLSSA